VIGAEAILVLVFLGGGELCSGHGLNGEKRGMNELRMYDNITGIKRREEEEKNEKDSRERKENSNLPSWTSLSRLHGDSHTPRITAPNADDRRKGRRNAQAEAFRSDTCRVASVFRHVEPLSAVIRQSRNRVEHVSLLCRLSSLFATENKFAPCCMYSRSPLKRWGSLQAS
jgi:hypothetical protein